MTRPGLPGQRPVKLAMRTFTNERGAELMAFAVSARVSGNEPHACPAHAIDHAALDERTVMESRMLLEGQDRDSPDRFKGFWKD